MPRRLYFHYVGRLRKWMFHMFNFSLTMPKLLLFPVYNDYYRFPVLEEATRCRSYSHCVVRPWKCKFCIQRFSFIIYHTEVNATSGLRRLLSTSGVALGRTYFHLSCDLENVCIAFEIFHLLFTVPELLLLPVGDGHILLPCLFPVSPEVA